MLLNTWASTAVWHTRPQLRMELNRNCIHAMRDSVHCMQLEKPGHRLELYVLSHFYPGRVPPIQLLPCLHFLGVGNGHNA